AFAHPLPIGPCLRRNKAQGRFDLAFLDNTTCIFWKPGRSLLRALFFLDSGGGAFFLDKPPSAWTKIGIAMAGLALGWLCYSIASNIFNLFAHRARRAPLGRRVVRGSTDVV